MRLRLFLTLGLVLLLSTFASSNECAHFCRKTGRTVKPDSQSPAPENTEYSSLVISKLLYV
jgi:hypothetical protein